MNQKAIQSTESPVMHILKQKVPESDSDTNALLQRHSMKEQNFLQTMTLLGTTNRASLAQNQQRNTR